MMIPDDTTGTPDSDDYAWRSETSRLLKAVDEESFDTLEVLLEKGAPVNAHGGAFHETPLHKAAQQGWAEGLQFLLSHGATVQATNQFGQTPLHYAAASKSCECIKSLLESGCHATLDHRDMRGHTPLHDAAAAGFPEGVSLLLKSGANVDVKDKNEETPLYKAAKARCVSSMLYLLNRGADMSARDKAGESVLSYVLRHLPAGMDALLDHCLTPNADKLTSKKLEVSFNFVPLAGNTEMTQMKILSDAVDLGHPKILLHPVCEAFLLLKWQNVRKLFFIEVIFYFFHAFLATILILDKFVWQGVKGTLPSIPPQAFHVLKIILLLQAVIILLKQLLTIIQGVRTWIFSLWHVLNGVIPVLVLLVVPGCSTLWQHHFATVTVLLIWVQCMLHIGRFPGCGIYVAMFTRVAKVFVRIFLIFFCLLLAFSLAFYVAKFGNQYNTQTVHQNSSSSNNTGDHKIIPGNQSETESTRQNSTSRNKTGHHLMIVKDKVYSDPGLTFIKTLTMMIGELDFNSDYVDQLADLPGTSHIIYVAFVILVSIILSNLLVALAVNDVQGLRNSAHLERLIKQMELVFQMERTFCSVLAFALILNFSWLHCKIKQFVHDFSSTKVFVQPFHPQKGSKLIMIQGNFAKEMNLRQSHVANVMECLRLREEENPSSTRKRSVRKSRQVRSEYSGFSNPDEELKDVLKEVERNLMESFMEKMEEVSTTVATLSSRLQTLEYIVQNTSGKESDSGGLSPPVIPEYQQQSLRRKAFQFPNHSPHSASLRNMPVRPVRNHTTMRNLVRRSQQHSATPISSLLQENNNNNNNNNRQENSHNQIEMVSQRSTSLPSNHVEVKVEETPSDKAT
ncbi:UNVERIFIED_CONTAM: hypothetical protein RMT77_012469 [Armadillidium vulgare]